MSERNFFDDELDAITSEADDLVSRMTAGEGGWDDTQESAAPNRGKRTGGSRLVNGEPPKKKSGGHKGLVILMVTLLLLIAILAVAFWKMNSSGTDLSALMFWKQQEETMPPETESLPPETETAEPTEAPTEEPTEQPTEPPEEETEAPEVSAPDSQEGVDVPLTKVLPTGFTSGLTTVNYYGVEQADAPVSVDGSIVKPLSELIAAAHEAGYNTLILHNFTAVDADPEEEVAEHETGLAVDFATSTNTHVWEFESANPDTSAWLQEHAHEYGFILRFPKDKKEITGVSYQPWHYAYVGVTVATEMKENGWCLEEYLAR